MGLRSERIVSRNGRDVAMRIAVETPQAGKAPAPSSAGACVAGQRRRAGDRAVRRDGIMRRVAAAWRRRDAASSAIGGSDIRQGDPR